MTLDPIVVYFVIAVGFAAFALILDFTDRRRRKRDR